MKILITGTSCGIGKATAELFLAKGHLVYGIDVKPSTINHSDYTHWVGDVSIPCSLPNYGQFGFKDFDIVINNAATGNESLAIKVNLEGYIIIAEKFANHPGIKCVINVGSISGRSGLDGARYAASQGGRISYTKNLAIQLGNDYKARVNCISFGAVMTEFEPELYKNPVLVKAVEDENLLKKWIQPEEAAKWIYFVAVEDNCCTGQDILIDCGEEANYNWIEA